VVDGFSPSEKYESQLGWFFPIHRKTKFVFQTTNQIILPHNSLSQKIIPQNLMGFALYSALKIANLMTQKCGISWYFPWYVAIFGLTDHIRLIMKWRSTVDAYGWVTIKLQ
jgi:hypothetical protein